MFDIWWGDLELTTPVLALAVLLCFPLQLLLCARGKNRLLRVLPTVLAALLTAALAVLATVASGWEGLLFLLLALLTGVLLLACGLAWAVWWLARRIKAAREKR